MKIFIPVVEAAIFNREGKLLVLKRSEKEKYFPDWWEIPSGKVEWGEEPTEAVKREVIEETGLRVEVVKPYNVWTYHTGKDNEEFKVAIDFIVTCKDVAKVKINPEEHTEFKWVDKGEKLEATQKMLDAINKAFEAIGK